MHEVINPSLDKLNVSEFSQVTFFQIRQLMLHFLLHFRAVSITNWIEISRMG